MNAILKIERSVVEWLSEGYQRRLLRTSVQNAHAIFAQRHPRWAESLFDEHFVMDHLLPVLESAIREGVTVTPYQIALLWSQQIGDAPGRELYPSAAILAAGTQFLVLVGEAMAQLSQPLTTPVVPWSPREPHTETRAVLGHAG